MGEKLIWCWVLKGPDIEERLCIMSDRKINFSAIVSRIFVAFLLAVFFNLVCFGFLQGAELFLSQSAVGILSRVIWWPIAVSCSSDPENPLCAVQGLVRGFAFYWFVAIGLLWWFRLPKADDSFAITSLK